MTFKVKFILVFIGLTLLYFLTKYLLFLATYSYEIDIYIVMTGMAVLTISFLAVIFYKKVKLLTKFYFITVIGILTLLTYYKYTLTPFASVAYIGENFSGNVFIAFNQSDSKKIPVINNLLTLSIPADKTDFTGITATNYKEFFKRNFYFEVNGKLLFSEEIANAESKRIFEFKFDSIVSSKQNIKPFYFMNFFVTPIHMTTGEYLNSEYKMNFDNFKDSVETLLVMKIND